jgi:hypothetical protein
VDVWLVETGQSWDAMRVKGVFLGEPDGLKAFEKRRKRARKATGLRIQRYTYEDGHHESAWGTHRLRLRLARMEEG